MAATLQTVKFKVRKGDNLWDIVGKYGFPPKDWKKIYNAPYNKEFKKKRPDPNVIQPGDIFVLPKFTSRDIADIMNRMKVVQDLLIRADAIVSNMEKTIKGAETAIKKSKEVKEAEIKKLKRDAEAMETLAFDAANECSDMYSCMGAGLVSDKFQRKSRDMAKHAADVEKKFKTKHKDAEKSLATAKKMLAEARKQRDAVQNEMNKVTRDFIDAHAKPY